VKIKLKSFIVGLAALGLMASIACDAATQAQLQGVLQNVDSISGDVTVKLNDGSTITVNLDDVQVEALAAAVGSPSLEPGGNVTIERDRDQQVKTIKTHAAKVEGVIKALDQAKGEITIQAAGGDVTLKVTADTKIEAEDDDDHAVLADLHVGQEVEVKYQADTKTALKIEVEDEDDDDNSGPGNSTRREVHGTVTAVNKEARTITIRDRQGTEATYKLMPATQLEYKGPAAFDVIQPGMEVEVTFPRNLYHG